MSSKDDQGAFYKWLADHGMTEEQLETMAQIARTAYNEQRRARFPEYRGSGSKKAWLKVAMRCVQAKAAPADFIAVLWRGEEKGLYVNFMQSAKAVTMYREKRRDVESSVRLRITLQSERLSEWRSQYPDMSLAQSLTHNRGGYEPAFVYCIAKWQGLEQLADTYWPLASNTLLNPVYRAIYAEMLPEAFSNG